MHSATRVSTSFAALTIVLAGASACAPEGRTADADTRTVTPARYAVADFYKNAEFFGASRSPDRRKILVSSNLSGIYNA